MSYENKHILFNSVNQEFELWVDTSGVKDN